MVRFQQRDRGVCTFIYCITGVTATVETSVVRFIGLPPTILHQGSGNWYADKILFLVAARLRTTRWGPVVYDLVKYRSKWIGNENHLHDLLKKKYSVH